MAQALTLSITIDRPCEAVAAYLAQPENFARWASGLGEGLVRAEDGATWSAQSAAGMVTVRFAPANPFGIADHWVELGDGREVYVPLRVVANGPEASEVVLTLFRQPDMSDETWSTDAEWVRHDLRTLKAVLEAAA